MNIVLKVKKALKLSDLKIHTKTIEPNLQSKEVNPSIEQQNITCDSGYNGLSNVVVNGVNSSIDSNIQSGNIKDGVSILGVTGNYKLDVYQYFYDEAENNNFNYNKLIKSIPRFTLICGYNASYKLQNYLGEYIDVSGIDISQSNNINGFFYACSNLKELDLSSWDCNYLSNASYLFQSCSSLMKIDMRTFLFNNIASSYRRNMFSGVPTNCLIIVKDQTQKNKVASDYPEMTNVKTVAEYENE